VLLIACGTRLIASPVPAANCCPSLLTLAIAALLSCSGAVVKLLLLLTGQPHGS
jgi:hypothetical protein